MIFHESMYHNMRIHVIFLAPYFLPCLNFIRPHTIEDTMKEDTAVVRPISSTRLSLESMIVSIILYALLPLIEKNNIFFYVYYKHLHKHHLKVKWSLSFYMHHRHLNNFLNIYTTAPVTACSSVQLTSDLS